jgi:hypothetical protein
MKIDRSEMYILINIRNKYVKIADLEPDRIRMSIDAKNEGPDYVKQDISDIVLLFNDRFVTLTRCGLITLWKFNTFREEANSIYEIQLKRDLSEGVYEEFLNMAICERGNHLTIFSTFGNLMNRSRIFMVWITETDYMYLIAEKKLKADNLTKPKIIVEEE